MEKTELVIALVFLLAVTQGQAKCPKEHIAATNDTGVHEDHDSHKCNLVVQTCSKVSLETQCGDYTHQFTEDTYFGYKCENVGNKCDTLHLPFKDDLLTYRTCAPKVSNTVVVSVTHSVDQCSDTINVRYENITACTCQAAGTGTA